MRKVVTREKPDVAGKPVDCITLSKLAFMIAFDTDQYKSTDMIELAILNALRQLSTSRDSKSRIRDFVVLSGTMTNRIGVNLLSICLPERVSVKVTKHFFAALRPFKYADAGTYPLLDFSLKPFCRYSNGKLIVYTDTSSNIGWLPSKFNSIRNWGVDWETRSAELIQPAINNRSHTGLIPKALFPKKPKNGKHTLEDYQRLGHALDLILLSHPREWTEVFKGAPFGYKQLRSFCINQLGIEVIEDQLPGNCSSLLRVGRPSPDQGEMSARVSIRINSSVPAQTKYVALAHELAHYRLHFPWMLVCSLALDCSLQNPEVVLILKNLLLKREALAQQLEIQADYYSSYFLVSPMADNLAIITDNMMIAGRSPTPEELAWNFLTPFFPNEDLGAGTWKEHEVRTRHATQALTRFLQDVTPTSLLDRYFGAMVRRIRREYHFVFDDSLNSQIMELAELLAFTGIDQESKTHLQELITFKVKSEGWRRPTSTEEFMSWVSELAQSYFGLATEVSLKSLLPEEIREGDFICPIAILVGSDSSASQPRDKLALLPGMSGELVATADEWIARLPDRGLIIAEVSRKLLESITLDAGDVRTLILIPTPWNLEMSPNRDWYAVGVSASAEMIEMPKDRPVGTLNEWVRYCALHGFGLKLERLSEAQIRDLERISLVDPDLSMAILSVAKDSHDVDLMIEKVKTAKSLDSLPWEREDYFKTDRWEWKQMFGSDGRGVLDAQRYTERILQDCMWGGLFDKGFWKMMFKANEILKLHKIPASIHQETLEGIRNFIVDQELCGDFDRWFDCNSCGRLFMPKLNRDYVRLTVEVEKVLCDECGGQCEEYKETSNEDFA